MRSLVLKGDMVVITLCSRLKSTLRPDLLYLTFNSPPDVSIRLAKGVVATSSRICWDLLLRHLVQGAVKEGQSIDLY